MVQHVCRHHGRHIGRRAVAGGLAAVAAGILFGPRLLRAETPAAAEVPELPPDYREFRETLAEVLPESGFRSRITFGDSLTRLIEARVIDRDKFTRLYQQRGGVPEEVAALLAGPTDQTLHLTRRSAGYYVNLLWPLGLANHMDANAWSPVNGENLFTYASTGGWGLGEAANGGAYFNDYPVVPLTAEQEGQVVGVAKSIFRPCCGNSTFFQDCNHGSAMLGLMQLGTAQGLTPAELYREALAFNTHWFPDVYVRTALYFKMVEETPWAEVDPATVVSAEYSSGRNWRTRVLEPLSAIPGLLPDPDSGANCGV